MKNFAFILVLVCLLTSSCTTKYFEGRIVYERTIGPGRDSAMYASLHFFDKKAMYVGNGNTLELYFIDGHNEHLAYSILFLANQNKTYKIWTHSDTIEYYDNSIPEKGLVEDFTMTDSTTRILGYNCNIYKFQNKHYSFTRLTYYYINTFTNLNASITKNSLSEYKGLINSKLNAYPLKIVYADPRSTSITYTATEVKSMDTDSIFEQYKMIIETHPLKMVVN